MKALTLLSAAALAVTFSTTAMAGSGNGADGWRKLQDAGNNQYSQSTQTSNQMKGGYANCPMMNSQ